MTAARQAARQDVIATNTFADKGLKDRAAGTMGDTADQHQHQTCKAALIWDLAMPAWLTEPLQTINKSRLQRKTANRSSSPPRYANMKQAGLSVKDLQGPAVNRLAVMDSRALLLLEGQPQHAREGEARALVAESMRSPAYRATFTRETAEWTMSESGRQAGGVANAAKIDAREQTAAAPTAAADPDDAKVPHLGREGPQRSPLHLWAWILSSVIYERDALID